MLALSVHLYPQSALPFFVCLFVHLFVYDSGLQGAPPVSKFHGWQLIKKKKKKKSHLIQVFMSFSIAVNVCKSETCNWTHGFLSFASTLTVE